MQPFVRYMLMVLWVACWSQGAAPSGRSSPAALRECGRLYGPIIEASALLRSSTAAGLFWTLNDSLNPPILYVIDSRGRGRAEIVVQDENVDWEALAGDGQGNLYIGDIGNNEILGHRLAMRRVLRVSEPDLSRIVQPASTQPIRESLAVDAEFLYTFPLKAFDAEALFYRDGHLYLISKVGPGPTGLYEVDLTAPKTAKPLKKICEIPHVRSVTDASLSADGTRLALCSYDYVAIFAVDPKEPISQIASHEPKIIRFRHAAIEGCCWDGPSEIFFAAEGGSVFRMTVPSEAAMPK